MKIRQELAHIKNELRRELQEEIGPHDCHPHIQEGMSCMICCLSTMKKPLALIQYLRSRGLLLKVLQAETKFFDLLGEDGYRQKIKQEMKIVRNIPKKNCFNCGKIVAVWMPYSAAAMYVNTAEGRKLRVSCMYCGENTYFSKDEIRYKFKRNRKKNRGSMAYAIGLVSKFGYNDGNEDDFDMDEDPEPSEDDGDGDEEEE